MKNIFSTVKLVSLYSFCAFTLMGCRKDISEQIRNCPMTKQGGAPFVNGKIHMRDSSLADDPGMRIVVPEGEAYKPVSSIPAIKDYLRELRNKYSHGEIFDIGFNGEPTTVRCSGNTPRDAKCPAIRLSMLNVWGEQASPINMTWGCH